MGSARNPFPLILGLGLFCLIGPTGSQGPGFTSIAAAAPVPKDCERRPLAQQPQLYQLACDLRTINSEFDSTNFSVIPAAGTAALAIQCSDSLAAESRLLNSSFAHLTALQELSLHDCKLGKLSPGSLEGLSSIVNLTIQTRSRGVEDPQLAILPGALAGLNQLNRLDLSQSGLGNLPAGELCGLSGLTHLNLSHNRLEDLAQLGLQLPNSCELTIGSLDLSGNRIKQLAAGSLEVAKHMRALYLANNRIEQVHDGALRGLVSLRILDLSGNSMVALPAGLFTHTPDLRQLKLDNNRLSVISSRLFHPVSSLVILDLSYNLLEVGCQTCLGLTSFQGLSQLVVLNLASNRLSSLLQPSMFQDLSSLHFLDLSANQLTELPAGSLAGLGRLHTLKLAGNRLTSLGPDSLSGLAGLNTLGIENNSLSSLHPASLTGLPALQDLSLFGNALGVIPEAIVSLNALKTIDLGHNGIRKVRSNDSGANSTINLPPRLVGLKLDQNLVEAVTADDLASLDQLQILNLASNQISQLARGVFTHNRRLQAIRLDANRITDIVGLFSDLTSLRWLNISDNRIQKFDYFLLPRSLNWLDLHRNQIEDIGNYFDKEAELGIHTLDISFNRLRTINAKVIPDRVQVLSLNDNLITRIDPLTFVNKRHLVRVDLYANQIVRLDPASLRLSSDDDPSGSTEGLPVARPEFYLGGNPFLCDCNLEWLKTVNAGGSLGSGSLSPPGSLQLASAVASNYPIVRDLESIYCRLMYSTENAYIPLVEARSAEFLCPYTAHCFALCHCCDFDACDCEMTCPDNCTCYHDQAWSTNIVDCTSAGFLEPPTTIPMDATEVYLHGNNFHLLSSHSFIGRKNLRVLYLNHSNIEAVLNYTFFGLRRLAELHLDHNSLRRLEGHEFQSLRGLRVLYLDHNRISHIDQATFAHLDSLEVLRMHSNQLVAAVPGRVFSLLGAQNPYLVEVTLSLNPWSCECELAGQLAAWLADNSAKVADAGKVACMLANNAPGRYILNSGGDSDCNSGGGLLSPQTVSLSDTSSSDEISSVSSNRLLTDRLPLLIVGLSLLTVLIVVTGVVLYYRTELQVMAFHRWGIRLCHRPTAGGGIHHENKMYDAYVAYTIKDEQFVSQVLSPELEHGGPTVGGCTTGLRLCLHYRDLPANSYVADSMLAAVQASRCTVLVLSRHFILHEWSRYDIRSALHEVLTAKQRRDEKRPPAVILLLGDVPHRELDPDLRTCLRRNIVIRWTDRLFWSKLRFYLPPSPGGGGGSGGSGADSAASSYSTGSSSSPAGRPGVAVPNYCAPIYEVPHHGVVGSGGGGVVIGPPLGSHHLLQHKVYEQRTLEYQLSEKLY